MKSIFRTVAAGLIAAVAVALSPMEAVAGQNDNPDTAVKIIAGVAAVGIIAAIASSQSSRSYAVNVSASNCAPPPPRYAPHPPPKRWVPGHYEVRHEKVCIPGYWESVHVPAEYGWVWNGCYWEHKIVNPACTKRVWVPERYEWQETRVWVAGHYELPPGHAKRYARAY